jgi:hypothetical protein
MLSFRGTGDELRRHLRQCAINPVRASERPAGQALDSRRQKLRRPALSP